MRAVVQRVKYAQVVVNEQLVGSIQKGLLILLGIHEQDQYETDAEWLLKKIPNLRIFEDEQGIMNKSVLDINGELLIISQFTLCANTKKGNRPSYIEAMRPDLAAPFYQRFVDDIYKRTGLGVASGIFGADMQVSLNNYGPVTIILDTFERNNL